MKSWRHGCNLNCTSKRIALQQNSKAGSAPGRSEKAGPFASQRTLTSHSKKRSFSCQAERISPYEAIVLRPVGSSEELESSCAKLARHLEVWLNEEWTPLAVHRELADRTAQVYRKVRLDGEAELGSVLLGVSTALLSFDFAETFVDAFEVSNKTAELLMLQEDREVCCRSEEDREQYDRVQRSFQAQAGE